MSSKTPGSYIARIRRVSDGVVRERRMGWAWADTDGWTDAFWWTDGNFGCDCNRHLEFERAVNLDYDDGDDGATCGDRVRYDVQIVLPDGSIPVDEFDLPRNAYRGDAIKEGERKAEAEAEATPAPSEGEGG